MRERAVRQTKSKNLAKPKTLWPPTCNSARFTRNQVTLLPNNLLQLNMENKYNSKHDLQKPKDLQDSNTSLILFNITNTTNKTPLVATNQEWTSVLDCAQGHPPRGMIQVVVRFSLKSSGLRMQILNNYVSPSLDSHWNHATAPVHFVFRRKWEAAEVQKIPVAVNGFWQCMTSSW